MFSFRKKMKLCRKYFGLIMVDVQTDVFCVKGTRK